MTDTIGLANVPRRAWLGPHCRSCSRKLLELDSETLHHAVTAVLFLDGDSIQLKAAGLQLENVVENLGQGNPQQLLRVDKS
jgi:hypothetical protein